MRIRVWLMSYSDQLALCSTALDCSDKDGILGDFEALRQMLATGIGAEECGL